MTPGLKVELRRLSNRENCSKRLYSKGFGHGHALPIGQLKLTFATGAGGAGACWNFGFLTSTLL